MEDDRKGGRIAYIDSLKGVAAFLVVLGHIVTYDADFHRLYNFIYSFHMPLFMFLSGCTAELSYRSTAGTDAIYLRKRFQNIMVPYFAWAFLLPVIASGSSAGINWHSIMMRTFVTNRMFWFLPTLYGLIVAYVCYQRTRNVFRSRLECLREKKRAGFLFDSISCMIVVGVIAVLMLLTGYQLFRDIVGFTIPFFAAVMYMEHEWLHELFHKRASTVVALLIFILLIGRFDFERTSVWTSLLRMLLGMCATVVLFHIFTGLQTNRLITKWLSFWGRYSLLIYILHIQIVQKSGMVKIDFSNKAVTFAWYCVVSCLVCLVSSALAVGMEHIPIVKTVLLGKKEMFMLKNEKLPSLGSRQSEWLFYISLAILSLTAFLFLGEAGYVLFDDSSSYMNIHANMEGVMPIYPLFLYGNKLLFGENNYLYAVIVEQAILASACVMIFIRVIKKRFALKYWESYVCYALALLPFTTDMPEAMTTHEILTEGIAYAVFYLFIAALMCAVWDKSLKWLGIACVISLVLALIRSQLQILFAVCGVICVYVVVLRSTGDKKRKKLLRFLCGLAGCMVITLAGVWCVGRISSGYQRIKAEFRKEQQALQEQENTGDDESTESGSAETKAPKPVFTTSQYVSLIFSRGMYEADYEDYLLFEEGQVRDLYLILYERSEKSQCRYVYAEPGLWMWRDIVGGIGSVGSKCFYTQNNFYNEHYPELVYSSNYSAVRNSNQLQIGLTLLKAHFGRFLYHTLMLLPQAFICTVFFQIERIYLLCHIVTLLLYLSATVLMIWAYRDKKVENAYGEFMCSVLGTNLILILVISLVFFGQQRYLVYNFGIFYIAYFLLVMQLWKLYGRDLAGKVWYWFRHRGGQAGQDMLRQK